MESDRRVTVRKLTWAHDVTIKTIHATLHKDMNLSKKSAKREPKLINVEVKKEWVRMRKSVMVCCCSAAYFHIPGAKHQSKQ
jgi:hypothetical protein